MKMFPFGRALRAAAFLSLAVTLPGVAAEPSATFARIDLNDGRTLKDVTVRSYDPATGRVLLLAGRTAMTLPLALIPSPFDEQVKAAVPLAGSNLTTVAPRPAPVVAVRPATREVHVSSPAPSVVPSGDLTRARHRAASVQRAQRFFTYEFQAGSSAISVYDRDIEVEETEAIEGWPGRYRTKGRAYLQFYDSRGRSFSRTTSRFEVITEQKPGREVAVVDFTRLGEFR